MEKIARKATRFVGLDVHVQTISVAVAEKSGEVRSIGSILNRPEARSRGVGCSSGWISLAESPIQVYYMISSGNFPKVSSVP